MKIVYIADLHFRATAPINRKDDYVEAQFRKLGFLVDCANENKAEIVIGGDVFDRAVNHPSWFINKVIDHLTRATRLISIIPGNHDLLGHSLETFKTNTIAILNNINVIYVHTAPEVECDGESCLSFAPFGTVPCLPIKGAKNVLVLHEPVFEDTVPFYMPEALTVKQLEAKYPGYDLYLAGDIHIPCAKSKTLVSGSMMRMTTVQKDHKPRFYVIDTETLEVETVFFPIEEDVWKDTTEVVVDDGFKKELNELALAMQERDEQLEYRAVCQSMSGEHWPKFDTLIQEYKSKQEKS